MATVLSQILKVLQRADPYMKDGVEITSSNIATWVSAGGDRFTAQRIIDCYNQGRMQLANVVDKTFPEDQKALAVSGNIVKGSLVFASGTITKPAGYVMWERLEDPTAYPNAKQVLILPVSQIQQAKDLISSTNLIVFDYGTSFTAYDGTATISNGTYPFYYYGVTQYTTTTATDGTTAESFNDLLHPVLVDLAVAIANEQGTNEISAMALKFMGGQ